MNKKHYLKNPSSYTVVVLKSLLHGACVNCGEKCNGLKGYQKHWTEELQKGVGKMVEAGQQEMKGKEFEQTPLGKVGKVALSKHKALEKAEMEYDTSMVDVLLEMKKTGKKKFSMKDSNNKPFTFYFGIMAAREKVTIKAE